MPSSKEKRNEQQRARRDRNRLTRASVTTGPTTDQVAAGPALADAAGEENCKAPSQATEESTWSLERPPRLFEDFGGEAGRCSYERAREQWYHRFTSRLIQSARAFRPISRRTNAGPSELDHWQRPQQQRVRAGGRKRLASLKMMAMINAMTGIMCVTLPVFDRE